MKPYIVSEPYFDGLQHTFILDLGIVYYCFTNNNLRLNHTLLVERIEPYETMQEGYEHLVIKPAYGKPFRLRMVMPQRCKSQEPHQDRRDLRELPSGNLT